MNRECCSPSAANMALWILLPLLLLMATKTAASQTGLSHIFQLAQNNDPLLKEAEVSHQAGKYQVIAQRGALLPQAGLSINFSHSTENMNAAEENYRSQSYAVQLSQTLFDAEAWYRYRAARAQQQAADVSLEIARQTLILRVTEAYATTLKAEASLMAARAEVAAIRESLHYAVQRHRAGLVTAIEAEEARAAYDTALAGLHSAEAGVAVSYEKVQQLTGSDVPPLRPLQSGIALPPLSTEQSRQWADHAWQQQLLIREASAQLNTARQQYYASSGRHLPSASMSLSRAHDRVRGDSHYHETTTTLSAQITLPVLNGGRDYGRRKQADWQLRAAAHNVEKQRRHVSYEVRRMLHLLNNTVKNIAARRQVITSASVALAATEQAHRTGTRNMVDVLQARKILHQAQRDYEHARYDYLTRLVQLKYYAGVLDQTDISLLDQWLSTEHQG